MIIENMNKILTPAQIEILNSHENKIQGLM